MKEQPALLWPVTARPKHKRANVKSALRKNVLRYKVPEFFGNYENQQAKFENSVFVKILTKTSELRHNIYFLNFRIRKVSALRLAIIHSKT